MLRPYVLIDGNNIGFAAHQTAKLVAGRQETQAVFGFLRTLNAMLMRYAAFQPIVLWDGRSWRKDVFSAYKAHRDANPKQAAMRDGYKAQKPMIIRALRNLGVWQMMCPNFEADDLAGAMVRLAVSQGRRVSMITGDHDWLQLVGDLVTWVDPIRDQVVTPKNFVEFTGYATTRAFLEGKALQGDAGDLGPGSGVGGIGEKGALELITKYGSVADFLLNAPAEIAFGRKMPKKWIDFAANTTGGHTIFERNMALMDLNPTVMPSPEKINLWRGEYNEEQFIDLCAELAFKTILKDLARFTAPFRNNLGIEDAA